MVEGILIKVDVRVFGVIEFPVYSMDEKIDNSKLNCIIRGIMSHTSKSLTFILQ